MNITPTSPNVIIRQMLPEDGLAFVGLIDALADYENLDRPDPDAKARLLADAFSERPRFEVRLAEVDGVVAGYAFFFMTYSSFLAKPLLYLEDIFVLTEHRGVGAGKALFDACVTEARARGCGRMEWRVLTWNEPAIAFYRRRGAQNLEEWHTFRLDGAALSGSDPE
jgi:GNAT superfamily N-acetyltransferase